MFPRALARNHAEGWQVQGDVSFAKKKYLLGLDDGGTGARSRQSSPLLLNVREVARCHGPPLPCGQATIPALAGEVKDSPTEAYQTCSFYRTARCPAMAGL